METEMNTSEMSDQNKLLDELPPNFLAEVLRDFGDITDFGMEENNSAPPVAVFDVNLSPAPQVMNDDANLGDTIEMTDVDPDFFNMQPMDPNPLMFINNTDALGFALGDQNLDTNILIEIVPEDELPGQVERQTVVVVEEVETPVEVEEKVDVPVEATTSRKRRSSARNRQEPPKKRGRKPKYPPGEAPPRQRRPRKIKLYEREEFEDPEAERKRLNALNAKLHRQKKKEEKEVLQEQLNAVTRDRDELKQQLEEMKRREAELTKALERMERQRPNSTTIPVVFRTH